MTKTIFLAVLVFLSGCNSSPTVSKDLYDDQVKMTERTIKVAEQALGQAERYRAMYDECQDKHKK